MSSTGEGRPWISHLTLYFIYLVLITTVGPLQFGFHLAELNAPQDVITCAKDSISAASASRLPQCIPMNLGQFGLVQAILDLGGVFGALVAGPASSKYGRLPVMRLTNVVFLLGALLETLAPSIFVLALGRFVSGIGAGAAIVVVPVYIAGISPPQDRGLFGAFTQVMINVGILVTQVLGYFLSHGQYWRVIFAAAGGIALLQLLGLLGAVESPQWRADNGDPAGAERSLRRIRGPMANIEEEIQSWALKDGADEEEESLLQPSPNPSQDSIRASLEGKHVGVFQVLREPHYRPAIIAVAGVMVAQQFCGINGIVMYGVALLSELLGAGSGLLAIAVSAANLIMTILCAPLADRLGRKVCLLLSIAGMGLNAFLLAISIIFSIPVLSMIAAILFVASFAVGLGPVPFILASELVEKEAVGATQSWALVANWMATFIVAQFFPILNEWMGKGRIFFLFTALAAGFFAFVVWCVPESKGRKDADEVWGRQRRVD
ncbi:MAG: hypothetical protein M1825_002713 [Sarcosagium campestre]|nr:MAG: hypothetical protein M1825_002713 [Sarcosagium campestre]